MAHKQQQEQQEEKESVVLITSIEEWIEEDWLSEKLKLKEKERKNIYSLSLVSFTCFFPNSLAGEE